MNKKNFQHNWYELVLKISAPNPQKKLLKFFNSLRIIPFGIKLEQIDRQF